MRTSMSEPTFEKSPAAMGRGGFLGRLLVLGAALGLGFLDLGPLFRRDAGGPARPSIKPPLGSVKRRG
jgi:hypothetical protein